MISIIVPVYKVEKYICSCIDSILSQSYKDWELILVDDGSPDNSGIICDEYATNDNRIRVIHKENEGVTAARRDGVMHAEGEWIVFVDSDDTIPGNSLEVLLSNSKDVDTVCGCLMSSKGKKWKHKCIGTYSKEDYITHLVNGRIYGYPCASLFKRSLFKDDCLKVDRSFPIGEDVLMRIELAMAGKNFRTIEDVVYNYFDNTSSVMHTKVCSPLYYNRFFEIRNEIISSVGNLNNDLNDYRTILSSYLNRRVPYKQSYFNILRLYYHKLTDNDKASLSRVERIKSLVCMSPLIHIVKWIQCLISLDKKIIVLD